MTPLPQIEGDGPVLISRTTLRSLIQAIRERTPLPANGQNIDRRSMGFVLDGRGRTPTYDHPFKLHIIGQANGLVALSVSPGTVNGIYPTLDGVTLATLPRPTVVFSAAASLFVTLQLSVALSVAEGYVHAGAVTSVLVGVGASEPSPSDLVNGSGNFTIHLGRVVAGRVVAQNWMSSLSVTFCDSSNPGGALAQMTVHGLAGLLAEEE